MLRSLSRYGSTNDDPKNRPLGTLTALTPNFSYHPIGSLRNGSTASDPFFQLWKRRSTELASLFHLAHRVVGYLELVNSSPLHLVAKADREYKAFQYYVLLDPLFFFQRRFFHSIVTSGSRFSSPLHPLLFFLNAPIILIDAQLPLPPVRVKEKEM
jgi:hypothetical protein